MADWFEFHGGYDNVGPFNNVILGGAPGNRGFANVDLRTAHGNGVGYGIRFTQNASKIRIDLNLAGFAVNDSAQWIPDQRYVHGPWTYNYFLKIEGSTNNGASYFTLSSVDDIFVHDQSQDWTLLYRGNWLRTARASQWSGEINFPAGLTHIRVALFGDIATMWKWVYFSIEELDFDYVPMAERVGTWKSLNKNNGHILIRKNGRWVDKSRESVSTEMQKNKGHNRIRQGGDWKQLPPMK